MVGNDHPDTGRADLCQHALEELLSYRYRAGLTSTRAPLVGVEKHMSLFEQQEVPEPTVADKVGIGIGKDAQEQVGR